MHAQQDVEKFVEKQECILDAQHRHPDDIFIDLSNDRDWKRTTFSRALRPDQEGLYSLLFARCHSIDGKPSSAYIRSVSFTLQASFQNPGPNFLSAGDIPLPAVYMLAFLAFAAATGFWYWLLARPAATHGRVQHVHYMMAILAGVKTISLLLESVRYHYIALVGVSHLWSDLYYIFAALKGVMLFVVILLVGSGWSLMKGYLNAKEKRIIMVVLVMQVFNNVSMVVIEETAPGSKSWLAWRDTLHVVDILCCAAILFPIVWNIRHLRQASEVDGKVQRNLLRLKLFRQFYVMVIAYIYFTRIGIDFLLEGSVPYHMLWLGPLASEATTLLFFVLTGAAFRPSPEHPYMALKGEDDDIGGSQPPSGQVRVSLAPPEAPVGAPPLSEEEAAGQEEYGLNASRGDIEMQGKGARDSV